MPEFDVRLERVLYANVTIVASDASDALDIVALSPDYDMPPMSAWTVASGGEITVTDEDGDVLAEGSWSIGRVIPEDEAQPGEEGDAEDLDRAGIGRPPMKMIHTQAELQAIARELGVRADWHEPDEQEVTAEVQGHSFDNAGFWGEETLTRHGYDWPGLEMYVTLYQDGKPVAEVSLATLFAMAAGTYTGEE
jgi:hypothetical protein